MRPLFREVLSSNTAGSYLLYFDKAIIAFCCFPIIGKIYGLEALGIIFRVYAVMQLVGFFIDWSSSRWAVRLHSNYSSEGSLVSDIIPIFYLRTLLALIPCLGLLVILILGLVPDIPKPGILTLSCICIITSILNPFVFYQITHDLWKFGLLLIVSRFVSIGLLLLTPSDILDDTSRCIVILSIPSLVSTFLTLRLMTIYRFELLNFKGKEIISLLVDHRDLAISSFAGYFYSLSPPLFLGLVCSDREVGVFSLVLSICRALSGALQPILLVLAPRSVQRATQDAKAYSKIFLRDFRLLSIIATGAGAIILISSVMLLRIAQPVDTRLSILCAYSLIPMAVAVGLSTTVISLGAVPLSLDRPLRFFSCLFAVVSPVIFLMSAYLAGAPGLSMSLLVLETAMLFILLKYVRDFGASNY